jgi:hypothetical protein
MLFVVSDEEAMIINLKLSLHHNFPLEGISSEFYANFRLSYSSRYLSWCGQFDQESCLQEFKVLDLLEIYHPSTHIDEHSDHVFHFKEDSIKIDTSEPISEVRWQEYDYTSSELVMISFESGRLLLLEVIEKEELEEDTIVAIALNAAISAGVVSSVNRPTPPPSHPKHGIVHKPLLRVLKEITRGYILSQIGIWTDTDDIDVKVKGIAWLSGFAEPTANSAPNPTNQGTSAPQSNKAALLSPSKNSSSSGFSANTPRKTKAFDHYSIGSWIAVLIQRKDNTSTSFPTTNQILLMNIVYDSSVGTHSVIPDKKLLFNIQTHSNPNFHSESNYTIDHVVGYFHPYHSHPRSLEVIMSTEDKAIMNSITRITTKIELKCQIATNGKYDINVARLQSYAITNVPNCNAIDKLTSYLPVQPGWMIVLTHPIQSQYCAEIMTSLRLPTGIDQVKVIKQVNMHLPVDIYHQYWILLCEIADQKQVIISYRIASQSAAAQEHFSIEHKQSNADMYNSDSKNDIHSIPVEELESDLKLQYTVEIIPDVHYGLGMRLDEVKALFNPQQLQIIVTSFKRHPITKEPLSAELSGAINLGDELIGINNFRFAGQPLSAVIPTIRTILSATSAEQTVQLIFRKVETCEPSSPVKQMSKSFSKDKLQIQSPSSVPVADAPGQLLFSFPIIYDYPSSEVLDFNVQADRIISTDMLKFADVFGDQVGRILIAQLMVKNNSLQICCQVLNMICEEHIDRTVDKHHFSYTTRLVQSSMQYKQLSACPSVLISSCSASTVSFRQSSKKGYGKARIAIDVNISDGKTTYDTILMLSFPKSKEVSNIILEELKPKESTFLAEIDQNNIGPVVKLRPIANDMQLYAKLYEAVSKLNDNNVFGPFTPVNSEKLQRDSDRRNSEKSKHEAHPMLLIARLLSSFIHSTVNGLSSNADEINFDNTIAYRDVIEVLLRLNPSYSFDSSLVVIEDVNAVINRFKEDYGIQKATCYLHDKLFTFFHGHVMHYILQLAYDIDHSATKVNTDDFVHDIVIGDNLASPTAFSISYTMIKAIEFILHPLLFNSPISSDILNIIDTINKTTINNLTESRVLSHILGHICRILQMDKFSELMLYELSIQNSWMHILHEVYKCLHDADPKLFTPKEMLLHPDQDDENNGGGVDFSLDQSSSMQQDDRSNEKHLMLSGIQAANLFFSHSQSKIVKMFLHLSTGATIRSDSSSSPEQKLFEEYVRLFVRFDTVDGSIFNETSNITNPVDVFGLAVDLKLSLWLHDIEPLFDSIYQYCLQTYKTKRSSMQVKGFSKLICFIAIIIILI